MRKVVYTTERNYFSAQSLRKVRIHVMFFNSVYQRNPYDGDYVLRYVHCDGELVRDYSFCVQINVVNGRVILRRVKVPSIPDVGSPV